MCHDKRFALSKIVLFKTFLKSEKCRKKRIFHHQPSRNLVTSVLRNVLLLSLFCSVCVFACMFTSAVCFEEISHVKQSNVFYFGFGGKEQTAVYMQKT